MSESIYTIHTDGGARGNPGPAAIGVHIESVGQTIAQIGRTIGSTTNNQAEYQAIIAGLEYALAAGVHEVHLFADSELIVKQMRGEYRVKNKELGTLFLRATSLANQIGRVTYTAIPREQNTIADQLVNDALDGAPTPT